MRRSKGTRTLPPLGVNLAAWSDACAAAYNWCSCPSARTQSSRPLRLDRQVLSASARLPRSQIADTWTGSALVPNNPGNVKAHTVKKRTRAASRISRSSARVKGVALNSCGTNTARRGRIVSHAVRSQRITVSPKSRRRTRMEARQSTRRPRNAGVRDMA